MTTSDQIINQVHLEITMEKIMIKQAMRAGVVFEDIKRERLRIKELQKKLEELTEANKVKN